MVAADGRRHTRPFSAQLHAVEAPEAVPVLLITAHAGVLLADSYLRPGIAGITLPFQMSYRPLWTGIGIIAAWLTAILGPSFYARKWIGVKTWRWLHRWIIAAYLLAVAHVAGAGTDGHSPWMIALLTILTAPFSPPAALATGSAALLPAMAIAPNGSGAVAWIARENRYLRVMVARRRADGSFAPAVAVSRRAPPSCA